MIQSTLGGDTYLIEVEEPYPVDFNAVIDQSHQEKDDQSLPALQNLPASLDGYDVVFIGYPVWSSTIPAPVRTFLSAFDLSGKMVIPFCTHDGYGAGSSYAAVEQVSMGANTAEGLAVDAKQIASAQAEVDAWLAALSLPVREGTPITVRIGDTTLDGVLNDSPEAQAFIAMLPQTVSMVRYGGREFYGGISGEITTQSEGRYTFDDGDITYCPANNTAAIFYAQTDRPNLGMEVFTMGRITSDLGVFDLLDSNVDVAFALVE